MLHLDFNSNQHLSYVLNDTLMKTFKQEKDLGVLTSGTLLWNDQIVSVINKRNQMMCWITRNLISREKPCDRTLTIERASLGNKQPR